MLSGGDTVDITNENVLEAKREYQRAWRKANKKRVQEYNRRYWERRIAREDARLSKDDLAQEGN